MSDRYAVTGYPVAHSLSPLIHRLFAEQTGESMDYGRLELEPDEFERGCRAFFAAGGRGLNVTMPHKLAALELCDAISAPARIASAVNTIKLTAGGDLFGTTTDGEGLVRDLTLNLDVSLKRKRVLLLGAGGSARGTLGPLLGLAPAELVIANRTAANARELAARFADSGPVRACALDGLSREEPFDVVFNATAASLSGRTPAISEHVVRDALCYDFMYRSGGTPFTDWAAHNGARAVQTGIGMLVEQAAVAFALWRDVEPRTGPVLALLARTHGLNY